MLIHDGEADVLTVENDLQEEQGAFLNDCIAGLGSSPKTLPCKWLYDAEGSRLFEMICELPEYYQTRTETKLLRSAAPEIASTIEPDSVLVEFGSGASVKTRILLDAAPQISTYVPIDICVEELDASSVALRHLFPDLNVSPIHADFTQAIMIDAELARRPLLGFFPGSTIGNFEPREAQQFLSTARDLLGENGRLLLGADLRKDIDTLLAAYDDAAGVTAAFNLNLLSRISHELGGDVSRERFVHDARWNEAESRIEMHLVSAAEQEIRVGGQVFHFDQGESIHTENCHKYTLGQIDALATAAGWQIDEQWISDDPSFALLMLTATK